MQPTLTLIIWCFGCCFMMMQQIFGMINYSYDKNISDVAKALSEIIIGLQPKQLGILVASSQSNIDCDEYNDYHRDSNDFTYQLHKLYFKSVIFYDVELFFRFIEANVQGSIESVNFIFCKPYELSIQLQERKLAHRLSLFMFYWGAKFPPLAQDLRFEEPIRAVIITRPRKKAFRIYYNQAVPVGNSNLRLVNLYDGDNLGLRKVPLLPNAATVYANFQGRVFKVPVFHSPPWFWVTYLNESYNVATPEEYSYENESDLSQYAELVELNVTGGRDHRLLKLLAEHMNFKFIYIEAPGRTQGSLRSENNNVNENFTGGLGFIQNGDADFLLGDVSLSWERRKAVEFSFFILADSFAFATHAPRRLNEALAIVRPFKLDVWPYLIVTVLCSGPIFYAIIATPYFWRKSKTWLDVNDVEKNGQLRFHMVYIREITIKSELSRKLLRLQRAEERKRREQDELPTRLLYRCIWFTVQLFLKQSCAELYNGYRARFLMIVYWIAVTYVLADVYSAQLTSQFARPAHEAPINTLQRLQRVMLEQGYQLYVEKESSSLEVLENGTEIFRHLFDLMKQQGPDEDAYLIDSVESGIKLIADGLENKAVLGGRETLYFNIKQFGEKTFQLSQKLYTRYSAVAVQIGCPFLDSLNDVLMRLFEGGILEKMTSAEYETQSRITGKDCREHSMQTTTPEEGTENSNGNGGTFTKTENNQKKRNNEKGEGHLVGSKQDSGQSIQPLNLRMLQGAFIVLLFGYGTAGWYYHKCPIHEPY